MTFTLVYEQQNFIVKLEQGLGPHFPSLVLFIGLDYRGKTIHLSCAPPSSSSSKSQQRDTNNTYSCLLLQFAPRWSDT